MNRAAYQVTHEVDTRASAAAVGAALADADALARWYADDATVDGDELLLWFDEEFGYRLLHRCEFASSGGDHARLRVRRCERTFEGSAVPGVGAAPVGVAWSGVPSAAGEEVAFAWSARPGGPGCRIVVLARGSCDPALVHDRTERVDAWWQLYGTRLAQAAEAIDEVIA